MKVDVTIKPTCSDSITKFKAIEVNKLINYLKRFSTAYSSNEREGAKINSNHRNSKSKDKNTYGKL